MDIDYKTLVEEAAKIQIASQSLAPMIKEEISKAWKQLPNVGPKRSAKSWFVDPLSVQYALGYKDRNFSLTYDTIRRTIGQLGLLNAIINLRCNQIASFAQPYRMTRSLGYLIKHKDPDHPTTRAEVAFIKELEGFIQNCGRTEPNPYSCARRDDLDNFLRKIVRDSLSFDQVTAEVVFDRMGIPYEFYAVDASTIRIASTDAIAAMNTELREREGFNPTQHKQAVQPRNMAVGEVPNYSEGKPVAYVQVINGQIENYYNSDEMIFEVRNPRTDLFVFSYGMSECEQLINIITGMLFAEHYNRNIFSQGSSPHGILNLKGDNWTDDMLENFRRHWYAQLAGVENSHKMPILQSEGIEFIDFNKSNQEMEFSKWIEYQIKVICAVFQCDPAEVGFDLSGGVSQTPLFESSSEWKLKASKDRGLKPLLKFVSKIINKHIIDKIDDHFYLEFIGLDEMSEKDKHTMLVEQMSSYLTLNEGRRQLDLPDLPGGDIPMNPTYLQAMKMEQEAKQAQQQMQQPVAEASPEQPQSNALPGSYPDQIQHPPRYAATQGMPDFPFLDNQGE